jgi:hypothetical protein
VAPHSNAPPVIKPKNSSFIFILNLSSSYAFLYVPVYTYIPDLLLLLLLLFLLMLMGWCARGKGRMKQKFERTQWVKDSRMQKSLKN